MRSLLAALAAPLALLSLPATADEMWTTPFGDIVYETVIADGMAVFSAPAAAVVPEAPADARLWIYIPALANSDGARGLHDAFWIYESGEACPLALSAPDGRSSSNWGRAQIAFDMRDFPTGFTMVAGFCGWDPFVPVRAEANVGD